MYLAEDVAPVDFAQAVSDLGVERGGCARRAARQEGQSQIAKAAEINEM